MGNKRLSKEIYIIALIYTILLLLIGFGIGIIYDSYISENVENDLNLLYQTSFTSDLILMLEGEKEFCRALPYLLKGAEEERWRIGVILDELEKKKKLDERLKIKYFDLLLRNFFLSKKAYEKCGLENIDILYFYTNKVGRCGVCDSQGLELTIAREKLEKEGKMFNVYSFDGELNHGIVEYLKEKYNVKKYPTIIIFYDNSTTKLEGFKTNEEILNSIEKLIELNAEVSN